jgi:cytochrome oxidase assembly protein ShyY1
MIPRIISTRPFISLATALAVAACLFFIHTKETQIKEGELKAQQFSERNILPALTELPLPIAYSESFSEKWLFRKVRVEGEFLPDHEIYLENRVSGDIPKPNSKKSSGFHIMMPFLLTSGEIVWVNRGWVKRDSVNRQNIPEAPPLPGKQVITGYISLGQKNIFEMPTESPHIINGHVVALNFYLHDDKKDLPNRKVYPFLITQTGSGLDGLIRPEEDFYYTPSYAFDLKTWWFTLIIAISFWFISGIAQMRGKPPRL